MSKKCYEPIVPPGREDCPYEIEEIQGKECLSDSIEVINNNFFVLDEASCELTPEALKKLKIKQQGQFFDKNPDTYVLNFSGEGVNMKDEGFLKTVLIPFSGVRGIIAGRNVMLSATGIPGGHIPAPGPGGISNYKKVTAGQLAEGDVIINAYLPASPRQTRLFFYYGPNSASNPTANTWTQKNPALRTSIPSNNTILRFVNNVLNIPAIDNQDPLFSGGDVWVIYQLNGFVTSTQQAALTYGINLTFTYSVNIIGSGTQNGSGAFTASDSSNSDVTSDSVTNFIAWRLTREWNQSQARSSTNPQAQYILRDTYYLQNLSELDTSTVWPPTPTTWAQYS